jgi:putative ATP-binding cassette transporter
MIKELRATPYTARELIKAYWQSEERASAYFLLFSVLALSMILVGIEVAITNWYNNFYDALQEYNKYSAIDLLFVFVFLAALFIILAVYRFYIQQFLALRWRGWLTKQFVSRWLHNRSYYYLENFDVQTDNPDQRIQEDVGALVNYSLELTVGVITSVATIIAFIVILWKLSGIIALPLGKYGTYHIPGYLVWVSVIYSLIGTYLTIKIGRPLVALNFEQQKREADFRYAAVDLRAHTENVALYRGEEHQKGVLNRLVNSFLDNWYLIILRQKLLLWFTAGYNQVSVLVPIVVAFPNYFNKVFKLGGWMQTLAAFNRIQDALSFLVNSYTRIAEWQAVMQRLLTFLNHMHQIDHDVELRDQFVIKYVPQDKITATHVSIDTPQNHKLLTNVNLEFMHGKNYWLKGASGLGKSTFIRSIAGIWPYGSGEITLPDQKSIMFLPQKFYMPIGTLREALVFPDKVLHASDEELKALLHDVDMDRLKTQLHDVKPWSETLSSGELQRIAFMRVLLQKPDWVVLDESTSALDLRNEKKMYELLKDRLPNCSVISVGHRPSLAEYHDHEIDMQDFSVAKELA